jgi:hypothetical protein
MIAGIYKGPLQALSLEGSDFSLTPGARVELPDCDYTQTLIASGLLVPEPPTKATAPKAKETKP